MEKTDIDFSNKISNFIAMTENPNEEIAFNYLTKANWDETKAVNLYFNDTRTSEAVPIQQQVHVQSTNNEGVDDQFIQDQTHFSQILINAPNNNNNNQSNTQAQSQPGFFSLWFSPLINIVTSFCGEKRDVPIEEEEKFFSHWNNRVKNLNSFTCQIKSKLGIIILYTKNNWNTLEEIMQKLKADNELYEIFKKQIIVYTVLLTCNEGYNLNTLLSEEPLESSLVYVHNSYNNNRLNRGSILTLQNLPIDYIEFKGVVWSLLSDIESNKKQGNNLSNAEIIAQQQEDFRMLEQMEEIKQNEEKMFLDQQAKEKEEEEKKKKEVIRKAEEAKKKLLPEPSDDDPNKTLLIFRYPDGDRRIERKFLKSNTIENVYDFISSLGSDIYSEPDSVTFSLIQSFPFKCYSNMQRTLEEEQLFPNAVLQIKEE